MTDAFNARIFGWTITQGPPPIAEAATFRPWSGPIMTLDSSVFQPVPDQSITPAAPYSANLRADPSEAGWFIYAQRSFAFDLVTPYNCDLELTFAIQGVNPDGGHAHCEVLVNGTPVGTLACSALANSHTIIVPSDCLKPLNLSRGCANINVVQLGGGASVGNFLMTAIAVTSRSTRIHAQAQWVKVAAGEVPAGGNALNETVAIRSGISCTESEAAAFAREIGMDGSLTGSRNPWAFLNSIAAALSGSFGDTTPGGSRHSILLEAPSTESCAYCIEARPDEPCTYQFWQLAFIYTTRQGDAIEQFLGPQDAPLVVNIHMPSTGNRMRVLPSSSRNVRPPIHAGVSAA